MFSYIGVILTRAYIIYVTVHNNNGVEKRYLIFHHNFHKAIAYSWINNTEYRGKLTTTIATISTITSRNFQYFSVYTAS